MAASGSSHCWSATLVVFLVLLDLTTGQCEHVFLEQPDPVVEPLGTQVEVSCAVNSTFRTTWNILLPGREFGLATDTLSNIDLAANRGFVTNISSTENREPPLRINGTIGNSGTTVQCRATNLMDGFLRCPGRNFLVTFFGPPLAPENLTATADGLGSLQITWSQDNAVSVEFVVNATNVADSSEAIVMRTSQLNSVISFSDNTSCNNYSIQVVANNSAGQGPPSDLIIRSVPSLPEISAVKESLQHTLRRTSNGITLDVTLNAVNSCPEYPVHNYTLVVVDSEGNRATQTSQATGDVVSIAVSDLRENTRYSYYVIAANQFGNSNSSTLVEIMTTDVQNVTICLVGGNTFTINCVFLEGSNTNCIYSLREGVDISHGTIDRSNSEGDTIMVADIDGQLLAYASDLMDVGDDLAVIRNITEDSVLPCPVSTTVPTSTDSTSAVPTSTDSTPQCPCTSATLVLTSVVSVVVTALLTTVIFVLVQIAICKCHPKFTPGGSETGTSAGGEGQEYEEVDGGGGGVAVSDPTYMEVEEGGGNTFQLKENEAYASRADNN